MAGFTPACCSAPPLANADAPMQGSGPPHVGGCPEVARDEGHVLNHVRIQLVPRGDLPHVQGRQDREDHGGEEHEHGVAAVDLQARPAATADACEQEDHGLQAAGGQGPSEAHAAPLGEGGPDLVAAQEGHTEDLQEEAASKDAGEGWGALGAHEDALQERDDQGEGEQHAQDVKAGVGRGPGDAKEGHVRHGDPEAVRGHSLRRLEAGTAGREEDGLVNVAVAKGPILDHLANACSILRRAAGGLAGAHAAGPGHGAGHLHGDPKVLGHEDLVYAP
mmetsp:Transcript_98851/g.308508  ORF Transcript_98851/g.308508 Transcript_98851/m.308508 type:complete len:277 (-) Transcript_98851:277-1107(-)